MVVKGRFSRKAPPPKIIVPKLHNPYISNIAALKKKPNQQEALDILYDIANVVTPIMKEYGFKVKNLSEFSPKTDNLLGMNMNSGFKIYIRLRPPHNDFAFYPRNELIGTMLHELTHNKHGPHDAKFYKLLDELTTKQETILAQGGPVFEQEPFQGNGDQLGGKDVANIRDSRLKRLDIQYRGGVEKLGGSSNTKGRDLKDLVREAAIKRYEDNKWCHGAVKGDLPSDDELDIIEIDSEDDIEDDEVVSTNNKRVMRVKDKSSKKSRKEETLIVVDDSDDDLITPKPVDDTKSDASRVDILPNSEVIDLTND